MRRNRLVGREKTPTQRGGRLIPITQKKQKKKGKGLEMFLYLIILPLVAVSLLLNSLTTVPQNPSQNPGEQLNPPPQEKKASLRMANTKELVKSPTTVVTSFFPIKSKFKTEELHEWLERLLAINDPMVIFTSPTTVTALTQMRQHATDRTMIIPMSVAEIPLAGKYSTEIWDEQYRKDSAVKHAGSEEYWVWLSKTWFLNEAVNVNPFQSSTFLFTDLSSFKAKGNGKFWKGKVMMDHPEVIPDNRMLFMAHHEPNPPPSLWWENKQDEKQYSYHSNAFIAGNKQTIPKFHEAFVQVIRGFLDRGLFIGDDHVIAQSTCLQNPNLCAYVRFSQVHGDSPFYGLRSVLKRGGTYELWTPPAIPGGQTTRKEEININEVDDEVDVDVSGGSLPSAKVLLTQPPPFNDADIIKLSDKMITSPNTVVTAYFRVPSKFQPGKYDGWMRNMLSLQDAMVVFTHADLVPQIKELRSHALNRTVIIPLELDDLPIGTLYSKEFWQDQLDKDPEKNIHRSYELLWIWLSKTWCTTQAIRLNIFQSDLYVWSDIGCFRDTRYNSKTMILHRENVPPHEVIQMAHHKPNPPEEELWADKYHHKEHYYHSGSQFAAYKDTMKQFHEYFLETIDLFLERNMFIGEDQHVLQSVCLQHPEICAYAPFNQVEDNNYFGLRWVLHNDVYLNYWRYKKQ